MSAVRADDAHVRDVLKARAERLRARPKSDADEAVVWIAELQLGPERYALPLAQLLACLPLKMVTPVPLARSHVLGIARFRGQVISAYSLASILGVRGWSMDPSVLLVVEPSPGHVVAIDCERVPRPIVVPLAAWEQARAKATGAIGELVLRDGSVLAPIDLARLLADEGARA